jgi:hypothetical protein
MPTCTITGAIHHADDTPWSGAVVRFATPGGVSADATYPADERTATTDEAGALSIDLVAGLRYTAYLPDGKAFACTLPEDAETVTLEALRLASTAPAAAADALTTLLAIHNADPAAHPNGIAGGGGGGLSQDAADLRYAPIGEVAARAAADTALASALATKVDTTDDRLSDARTPTAHTQAWSTITATPTTLAGYGIADAATAAALAAHTGNTSNPHSTTAAQVGALATANNLSDLGSPSTARTNLGLGTAATAASTDFAAAGHVGAGGAAHAVATGSAAGFLSATDKSKLDGVATGATANATDAQLRDRSTHTGTQLAATISDLTTAVRAVAIARYAPIPLIMDATGASWTAMPNSATFAEWAGSTRFRRYADLSLYTQARFSLMVTGAGATGSEVRPEYSTDGGTNWNPLDASGQFVLSIAATAATPLKSNWITFTAGLTDVLLRVVGRNGNGSTSPTINSVNLEVRST